MHYFWTIRSPLFKSEGARTPMRRTAISIKNTDRQDVGGQKEKCGCQNTEDMRIEKCGYRKNAVGKITNDHIRRMMKYLLLTAISRMIVPVANKPGHPIEFRPGEVQNLFSITKYEHFCAGRIQKQKTKTQNSLDREITD